MQKKVGQGLFIAGAVLLIAGLMFVVAPRSEQQSQAAENYSSNWQATRVLTVESSGYFANVPAQEAAIGVAEWRVDGNIGGTTYEETWTAPSVDGTVFNPVDRSTSGPGFNPSHWLFASHIAQANDTPNQGRVTYRVKDLSFLNNAYTYSFGQARVGGNAIRCASNSDSNCLHARGSYGWEVYHAISNMGSDRGRVSASGVMMPLRWTVSGTIN